VCDRDDVNLLGDCWNNQKGRLGEAEVDFLPPSFIASLVPLSALQDSTLYVHMFVKDLIVTVLSIVVFLLHENLGCL
jgi:hypothetical protein